MFIEDRIDFDGFKKILGDSCYTQDNLAETLKLSGPSDRQDVEVVYYRVREDNPYNLLVRLFWLGRAVPEGVLRKTLSGLDLESLIAAGVLARSVGGIRSAVKLAPYHDLYLVSDFGPEINRELGADHVLGVGAASLTLASLTVRRKVSSALDLGCGAGIQTFLIANHADRVVGTDTNDRALDFAGFNARLNGIGNVSWKKGSLYEPVRGEKFDLIACNPPFVISPESKFIYRDTGMPGDSISEAVIKNAANYINNGGFACVLFNWHHTGDADWAKRPLEWSEGKGCDCWLICFKTAEPIVYAADWLKDVKTRDLEQYRRDMGRWMGYYEEMGIERVSAGAMIMRKREGQENWSRADLIDGGRCVGDASGQIERVFAAEDLLKNISDEELLGQRLVFVGEHELKHRLCVENGGWVVKEEELTITRGIPFSGNVDMYVAGILAQCDGSKMVGELIGPLAERLGVERGEINATCVSIFKKLLRAGFLST